MPDPSERLFRALTEAPDRNAALDGAAARTEPRSFLRHVAALSLSKTSDGLINPKLVLSWLLAQGGAPGWAVGLLVPVREAGALLPQLFTAARIRAMARRKWAWAAGSAVQGTMALLIGLAALTLEGAALGVAVVAALALLAAARSVCSVSYKDVLGRTVDEGRRGTATGLAASVSAAAVVAFALVLMSGLADRFATVAVALALAGAFWLLAAAVFGGIEEQPDPGEAGGGPAEALGQLRHLREDCGLALFVAVRGLLTATALAPPYLVLLGGGGALSALGALLLAAALAALVSAYVWGRLADRSSRAVLTAAGLLGALAMGAALALSAAGLAGTSWALPLALFALMLAHQGVRIGRSTWLVDYAPADRRAAYTSVANTAIGAILLLAGGAGAALSAWGPPAVLAAFAAMAAGAAALARALPPAADG